LLFLLLLLSFNFVFAIQAMLAGCPLASWCLNVVVVAAILPTVLELDRKYQRLNSVQLRGDHTFNINNTDISFIVCFDLVLFNVVLYSTTHHLIFHLFYLNYQNPAHIPFSIQFQNIHDLPSLLFIFISFHTTTLKTAYYCSFNCGLTPPQHNFYYFIYLI
jgi:hypothetical protein